VLADASVRKVIQQVALSIAAVLDVPITVVNADFEIVGGTAKHQGSQRITKDYIVQHVVKTKEPIIVENPGFHCLCQSCDLYQRCPETAEIDCPIILNENVIGIISLVGLTKDDKTVMLARKDEYLTFLKRMSELISSKVAEVDTTKRIHVYSQQLSSIIDSVCEGIVAVNAQGVVTHCNRMAEELLKVEAELIINRSIEDVLPRSPITSTLRKDVIISDKEYYFNSSFQKYHFYITSSPIRDATCKIPIGAIAIMRDFDIAKEFVTRAMGFDSSKVTFDDIKGESCATKQLKEQARQIAGSPSTVLIRGASGTGKELIARAIHSESSVSAGPFVAINCAAIPESLLESELFGYEGGAFTGAKKNGKVGKFELANNGTIFLDEIGDMSLYLQAKLLRVIQNKRIQRVGGVTEIPINARIIAATNQDLEKLMAQKRFREDLFYRLNVIPIHIPMLCDRKADIPHLVNVFCYKYSALLNKEVTSISTEAKNLLLEYSWPGNVRELENVIEYAVNMAVGNTITIDSLPNHITEVVQQDNISGGKSLKELTKDFEKQVLRQLLDSYGYTFEAKKSIAQKLDIGIASLYRRLKEYGISK